MVFKLVHRSKLKVMEVYQVLSVTLHPFSVHQCSWRCYVPSHVLLQLSHDSILTAQCLHSDYSVH